MKAQLSAPITRSLLPHYRSKFCVNARAKWLEKYDDLLHFCGHYSCLCVLTARSNLSLSRKTRTERVLTNITNQTNESNFLMEVGWLGRQEDVGLEMLIKIESQFAGPGMSFGRTGERDSQSSRQSVFPVS